MYIIVLHLIITIMNISLVFHRNVIIKLKHVNVTIF